MRLALLVAVLMPGALAWAQGTEEILSFDVFVKVGTDSEITITETIKVRAAGQEIKRGIYRDLPTAAKDREGNTLYTDYRILGATRNGKSISTFSENKSGAVRHYLGSKNVYIDHGIYTYTFKYRVAGQVGYFENVDEIYWNATGNDWVFPILKAYVVVQLPPGANATEVAAYTGRRGEKGKDFKVTGATGGRVSFATTRTLRPGEGLTVAVGWPKGFVWEPSPEQKAAAGVRANLHIIIGVLGVMVALAYYLFVWNRVGRDPEGGTIIPLFAPPRGYSPALTHTLMKMRYSDTAFAAAIVNMAVKGVVEIEESDGNEFTILKVTDDLSALSAGEKAIFKALLGARNHIVLAPENHPRIGAAQSALKDYLNKELESSHYRTNATYLIPGGVLSVLTVVALVIATPGANMAGAAFMSVWLTVWTGACIFLAWAAVRAWRKIHMGFTYVYKAIISTVMFVPFFAGQGLGTFMMADAASPAAVVYLVVIATMFVIFYFLLKAPTTKGRKVMDAIEGFKLYLSTAEKHRLEALHPPEETPALFEKYLPYALALGVENQWSERFAGVLAKAGQAGQYQPHWYRGGNFRTHGISGMSSSLSGGLSGALGASATAPGSSGGGGSGGGGGGGGGGGF